MSKSNISRSNLFLIELIIIITFFIFSTSIIVKVFAKTNELSINTTALNGAVIAAQNNAETYKSTPYDKLPSGSQVLYYDKNWQSISAENAYYIISVKIFSENKDNGVMVYFEQEAKFANKNNDDIIFALQSKKYFKK